MKCYVCNGTGKRFVPTNKNAITGNGYTADCLICNGTGKLVLTNEKYIRTCTFEELAGEIYEWYSAGYTTGRVGLPLNSITEIVGWLKEKHG